MPRPQRSPPPARRAISHRPRSPLPSRQVEGAAPYQRRHSPVLSSHAPAPRPHDSARTGWNEVFPASSVQGPVIRPRLVRAPLLAPNAAWEADRYDRAPYRPYPPTAPLEYRGGEVERYSDYRGAADRDGPSYRGATDRDGASYRGAADRDGPSYRGATDRSLSSYRGGAVYRDSGYAEAGYAATPLLERGLEYRQPSYDYGREVYRDYPVSRSEEAAHDYVRPTPGWDPPRHPDPLRSYPYKDAHGQDNR